MEKDLLSGTPKSKQAKRDHNSKANATSESQTKNSQPSPAKTLPPISRFILCIIGLLFCIAGSILLGIYLKKCNSVYKSQITEVEKVANNAIQLFNQHSSLAEKAASHIAKVLQSSPQDAHTITNLITEQLKMNPELSGIGISFEPYKHNPGQKLYSEFYENTADGKIAPVSPIEGLDYSTPTDSSINLSWYLKSLHARQGIWLPIYEKGNSKTKILEFNLPFYTTNQQKSNQPAGIISVYYKASALWQLMNKQKVDFITSHFIYNQDGQFIYHDSIQKIGTTNAYETNSNAIDKRLKKVSEQAEAGKFTALKTFHLLGGDMELTSVSRTAIPHILYAFSVDIYDFYWYHIAYFKLLAFSVFFYATSLISSVFGFLPYHKRSVTWLMVVLFVIICLLVNIGLISFQSRYTAGKTQKLIYSENSLEEYTKASLKNEGLTNTLKVGIGLDDISISPGNTALAQFHTWVITPNEIGSDQPPFQFANLNNISIKKGTQFKTEQGYVTDWNASGNILAKSDSDRFPFDNPIYSIEIKTPPLSDTFLTPDIKAYENLNPTALPGVNRTMQLKNWRINQTNFSYDKKFPDQKIFLNDKQKYNGKQYLSYNIIANRNPMIIFLIYEFPLFIVLSLGFLRVLNIKHFYNEKLVSPQDVVDPATFASNLTYFTGIFFVLVLANTKAIEEKISLHLSYIETCYFLVYGITLASAAIVAMTLLRRTPLNGDFRKQKASCVKYIYWPLTSVLFLIATLVYF